MLGRCSQPSLPCQQRTQILCFSEWLQWLGREVRCDAASSHARRLLPRGAHGSVPSLLASCINAHSSHPVTPLPHPSTSRERVMLVTAAFFKDTTPGCGKLEKARSRLYRSHFFESEYAFGSSRRDLHNALLCTVLESKPEKWGKKDLAKTTPKIGENKKTRGQ